MQNLRSSHKCQIISLAVFFVLVASVQAGPLDTWTWMTATPPRVTLESIAYGNGQFVVVGGTVETSTDGINWINRPSPGVIWMLKVAYGGGIFIATDGHSILTSPEGARWTKRYSAPQTWISDVAYGNGLFVATGSITDSDGNPFEAIVTSSDGVTWTQRQFATQGSLRAIAYGDSKFVALGSLAVSEPVLGNGANVLTSPDGLNWTTRLLPESGGTMAYGNNRFVAITDSSTALTSSDGVDWTVSSLGAAAGITFGNGRFVAVGDKLLSSTNGQTWTGYSTNEFSMNAVTYGAGRFVAVGYGGTILNSIDGLTWAPAVMDTSVWPESLVYGDGKFVGVTGNSILSSADAVHWAPVFTLSNAGRSCITYGNGRYVVPFSALTDGTNWIQSPVSAPGDYMQKVTVGDGRFVAVGFRDNQLSPIVSTIATSSDGVNWTWQTSPSGKFLQGVTFGNGTFVAVGGSIEACAPTFGGPRPSPVIITSPDGRHWAAQQAPVNNFVFDVAYGKGVFVAVTGYEGGSACQISGGEVISSLDGTNWVVAVPDSGVFFSGGYYKVAFGNGQFVAMGGNSSIMTSSDGFAWTRRLIGANYKWGPTDLTFGNGRFVAAGGEGIRQSDEILSLDLTGGAGTGLLRLGLIGLANHGYTIQSSIDLISWDNVMVITNLPFANVPALDPLPQAADHLFYRAYAQ